MRDGGDAVPVFGAAPEGETSVTRRAAYVVVRRGDGRVAAVRGRAGDGAVFWLPGGGLDAGETPREAAVRELREELGWPEIDLAEAGRAVQHFHAASDGCWYRMEATFFLASPPAEGDAETSGGEHALAWLDPRTEGARFYHASHAWAAASLSPPQPESRSVDGEMGRIAAKAVALVVRDGRVLVERCVDERAGTRFLRAIGGTIEFGETAAEAAAREWREELGLEIVGLRRLGVLENRFVYEGRPGHEIVFVFAAGLANAGDAGRDEWTATDTDGRPHTAVWVPVADVVSGAARVVPDGVAALLRGLG